jgi:hypothetical protein
VCVAAYGGVYVIDGGTMADAAFGPDGKLMLVFTGTAVPGASGRPRIVFVGEP